MSIPLFEVGRMWSVVCGMPSGDRSGGSGGRPIRLVFGSCLEVGVSSGDGMGVLPSTIGRRDELPLRTSLPLVQPQLHVAHRRSTADHMHACLQGRPTVAPTPLRALSAAGSRRLSRLSNRSEQ